MSTLAVPYHAQDQPYYCGAACLQMAIEALTSQKKPQADLYRAARRRGRLDRKTKWWVPPDGLEGTLDATLSGGMNYDLCALRNEDALTRRLIWSVENGAAPIALVEGYTHWVVVVGYRSTGKPKGPTDADYDILAIEIQDPWRTLDDPTAPPPPPPQDVAYTAWRFTYLKGVPSGYWKNKVVAAGVFGTAPSAGVDEPTPPAPRSAGAILSPDQVREAARFEARRQGLISREGWGALLGNVATPLLVQHIDEVDDYYYLVPFGKDAGPYGAVVRVDAVSGAYLEASAFATGGTSPWGSAQDLRSDGEARRRVAGQGLELPDGGGRFFPRPEGIGIHPSWVWKPCIESLSPFYPFRLVTIGDSLRYLRVDGQWFDMLHEAGPGM